MRIVKVHNYYTQPGGEDTVFHAETALLRSYGHEVVEYLEYNKKIESMNKASVALQTLWSRHSYEKIKSFLIDTKPEIVHFHNIFPLISPSAYYACKDLNIPVVQTLDNQRLICPSSTFYRAGKLCIDCFGKNPPYPSVLHGCYHDSQLHTAVVATMLTIHRWLDTWKNKVDVFFCSTDFYRDLFLQFGLPADKLVVMPHFVKENFQAENNNDSDYALFVGRLDPEKGVNTLLEAWRLLDFPLKIRGNGRLEEPAREFVKSQDMKHVEFLDRMEEQALFNLIGNARFLVMPSLGYYETFGMVIVEAYSRKIPVLASNIGVTSELVSDQRTGLLFESGNPRDLADKARWLWTHPVEARAMGEKGLEVYKERFTQEQCYKILIETYERLINKR